MTSETRTSHGVVPGRRQGRSRAWASYQAMTSCAEGSAGSAGHGAGVAEVAAVGVSSGVGRSGTGDTVAATAWERPDTFVTSRLRSGSLLAIVG